MSNTSTGKDRGLLKNSIALLAMSHITSLLGYVFWMACARRVSAGAIGMTSTVIAAMTLVAILTVAGFVPLLTRVLAGADGAARSGLCSTALALSTVVAGIGGLTASPLLPEAVKDAVGPGWLVGLLVSGGMGTAALLVLNAALLGVRRADLSLLGNVAASVLRLVAIAVLLGLGVIAYGADVASARDILIVWVSSLWASVVLSVWLLARTTPGFRFRPGRIWLSHLRSGVMWEHVATLGARLPAYAMPIIAAALVSPNDVGYLAMAWTICAAFYAVSAAVSNALLADCGDRPERLEIQVRHALRLIAVLVIIPVIVACLLASKVLGLFGADYATNATVLLILLLLSAFPEALVNVEVTSQRVRRRPAAAAAITVAGAAITIGGGSLLIPVFGINGAGWAALASPTIVAIILGVSGFHRGRAPRALLAEPSRAPSRPNAAANRPKQQLRVLHASDTFLPNVGGLELSVAALVRAQASRGNVVAVATAPHPAAPAMELLDGAQIHRLPMSLAHLPGAHADPTHLFFPPVPDPQFSRAFADLVDEFRPDVIHARGWILYSVLGAARAAGVPVVATAHDHSQVCATKIMLHHGKDLCSGPGLAKCMGCAYDHYGLKGIPLAAGLIQIASRRHREVDAWMAISTALAARGSAPRPSDQGPIEVIPTFLDDDLLTLASDERTSARPDFVPATGPYLFYAGALGAHKGVNVLLDAHRLLQSAGVDVPLVLAGLPRPDFSVPDRPGVTVVTNVPQTAVIAGWRHAAVGVVPSLVPEGFGRVAVECLAAGTPCVVSALGGLLDVVADNVEGLRVPPGDPVALAGALRRLLDDDQLRLRLGAAGPAKAARFTLAQVLPRLDEVYQRVVRAYNVASQPISLPVDDGQVASMTVTDREEARP